jgi:glutamate/tyrosine decarboxylase-like PLP-dependent enzyme
MTRVNHPRFHAYIPCPSSFAGAVGAMLAAGTNPFVGSWLGGSTVAMLELSVLDWIKDVLQLGDEYAGILTSGGSMANMIALAAARARFGRQMLDQGRIYVSDQGHASVHKAAQVIGFLPQNISTIRADRDLQIDVNQLAEEIEVDRQRGKTPFFVCANAGTTNSGAIDPLNEIAELCLSNNVWFHVDAAYGGFAALVPEIRCQMNGWERADSITLDPHKWLYCPMGVGCAFVRDRQFLEQAFCSHGDYLRDLPRDELNFLDIGPELSRPARVLPVWMVLRSVGREQLIDQIRCDIDLARMAGRLLAEDNRFEVDPVRLSIVNFRHSRSAGLSAAEQSARDDRLMEKTLADGELMLSSTQIQGRNTLRLVVMNHRTTAADIYRSVHRIRELAD